MENVIYNANGLNVEALTWALGALVERAAEYKKARNYYAGVHDLSFVTEKFRTAFANRLGRLKANLCAPVVDIPTARLVVSGFGVKTGDEVQTDLLREATAEIWEQNRMDSRAFDTHREHYKCGDAYMIVWPDEAPDGTLTPIFYPQNAGTCAVQYHPERPGYVIRAAKFWRENGRVRLNIYGATAIEKYVSVQETATLPDGVGGFKRYRADGEIWPLVNEWDKCPVFHFPNGSDRRSELNDVIDPQNIVNLAQCNLLVCMEFFAFPQRYVLGFDPRSEDPDNAGAAQWKAAMDRIWFHHDPDAKMGQFPAGSPQPYLEVLREYRMMIAEIAGIPPHYFSMSGSPPSGVALQIIEKRLSDKIARSQVANGNVWADIMLLALRMRGQAPADLRLTTEWRDTSPKDAKGEADTIAAKIGVGISRLQALREMRYSDTRITEMEVERAAETAVAASPATVPAV